MHRAPFIITVALILSPLPVGVARGVTAATRPRSERSVDGAAAAMPPDFNGDGFADLALGVPREVVGGLDDEGVVQVLYGSPAGLTADGNQLLQQDAGDIPGSVRRATSSVSRLPRATSTPMASPIWRSARRSRTRADGSMLARSPSCMGLRPACGRRTPSCSTRTRRGCPERSRRGISPGSRPRRATSTPTVSPTSPSVPREPGIGESCGDGRLTPRLSRGPGAWAGRTMDAWRRRGIVKRVRPGAIPR